jgi:hypothetical protein
MADEASLPTKIAELRRRLAQAEARLAACLDQFDRYNGNNPNKYQTDIKRARREVAGCRKELAARESVEGRG